MRTATTVPEALPSEFAETPLLREATITGRERWIYSAGFNVGADLASTARIDCELDDLAHLLEAGATVALLTHQGSYRDGTARSTEFLVPYLEERLGRPVIYLADPLAIATREVLDGLGPGCLALVGNTRMLAGEEECDPWLADRLAELGDRVALGGFSKAHRSHASNVGLLARLPGFVAGSIVAELGVLAPWSALREDAFSVAVLGGTKREKLDPGLTGLAQGYDTVIVGGAVLNALLAARGHDVGDSELGGCRPGASETLRALDRNSRAEIVFPRRLIVAPCGGRPDQAWSIPLGAAVPAGHAIVDFELGDAVLAEVGRASRFLLAGPPSFCRSGFRGATDAILAARAGSEASSLLLGGDSAAEIPWRGPSSSGGGSAIVYLATGECTAVEAVQSGVLGR